MSILSDIASALTGTPPASSGTTPPAEIAKRVRAARAHLAERRAEYGEACLAALDGNSARRDELDTEITAAERELAQLELALSAAEERAAAERGRQISALRASRVHSATIHARSRERAAKDLQTALETAGDAWKRLVKATDKMVASSPDVLPASALVRLSDLKTLVEKELFRVSGEAGALHRGRALPGAHPHDISKVGNPEAMEPMGAVIRRANDFSIGMLRDPAPGRTPTLPLNANGDAPLADIRPAAQPNVEPLEEAPEVDWSSTRPFVPSDAPLATVKMTLGDNK